MVSVRTEGDEHDPWRGSIPRQGRIVSDAISGWISGSATEGAARTVRAFWIAACQCPLDRGPRTYPESSARERRAESGFGGVAHPAESTEFDRFADSGEP